jgi:hypothetical protein
LQLDYSPSPKSWGYFRYFPWRASPNAGLALVDLTASKKSDGSVRFPRAVLRPACQTFYAFDKSFKIGACFEENFRVHTVPLDGVHHSFRSSYKLGFLPP